MKKGWDRWLWGIEFIDGDGEKLTLIGMGWSSMTRAFYAGEPSHPILFTTRATARAWCAKKQATYAGRTDCCGAWRFHPIRVRETVRAMRNEKG